MALSHIKQRLLLFPDMWVRDEFSLAWMCFFAAWRWCAFGSGVLGRAGGAAAHRWGHGRNAAGKRR
jgi:hypothetical protein